MADRKRKSGPVNALKQLESHVLKRFHDDLRNHQDGGFGGPNNPTCDNVRLAIMSAGQVFGPYTDRRILVLRELILREFLQLYIEWNGINGKGSGAAAERKKLHKLLSGVIRDFARLRKQYSDAIHLLMNNETIDQMILAFGELERKHPEKFPTMRVGLNKYRGARKRAWNRGKQE
ncbi:MAG TPA: hypothetical protein VGJ30_20360 [Candidatus Angelobacter sp.]|jgi:hypothetical protein